MQLAVLQRARFDLLPTILHCVSLHTVAAADENGADKALTVIVFNASANINEHKSIRVLVNI
jgi:hypothetical protein